MMKLARTLLLNDAGAAEGAFAEAAPVQMVKRGKHFTAGGGNKLDAGGTLAGTGFLGTAPGPPCPFRREAGPN